MKIRRSLFCTSNFNLRKILFLTIVCISLTSMSSLISCKTDAINVVLTGLQQCYVCDGTTGDIDDVHRVNSSASISQ